MTQEQIEQVSRICGRWFQWIDIPALWRNHDDQGRPFDEEDEKSEADQREADDLRQRENK